jgi:DNA-binding response OmpR family regulator
MSRPPRILVVDDNADLRELLWDALTADGMEVETVATAEAARAAIAAHPPSLVVVDVLLRGESGQSVADLARRSGIAVVLMTGDPTQLAALVDGSVPVLAKPFRLADLIRTVRSGLRGPDN